MKIFDLKEIYKLPFETSALMPALTARQVETHYKYHLLKYYTNLSNLLKDQDASVSELSGDLASMVRFTFGKQQMLLIHHNAGQIINHIYYFDSFVREELESSVIAKLKETFVNAEGLLQQLLQVSNNFGLGSCWLWVVLDNVGGIRTFVTPNSFTVHNLDFVDKVLCCIDLWEHAYYLDYAELSRDNYIAKILEQTNLYSQIK